MLGQLAHRALGALLAQHGSAPAVLTGRCLVAVLVVPGRAVACTHSYRWQRNNPEGLT